ncbi:MAG: NUDIX hydrolase [Legionellaceae bacterium]|nr:NUDIX hydrolase [Legionellaceae bacterium]
MNLMKFCSQCGSDCIVKKIPKGDNIERQLCNHCHTVFYQNPKVIVGAVVTYQGKYLLCRRNIEPQIGLWTYPAGFLENNETIEEGAIRETYEESKATIDILQLLETYSLTAVKQVHIIYSAEMRSSHFEVTAESSEVKLFDKADIPWNELAFPVIQWALKAHATDQEGYSVDSRSTNLSLEKSLQEDL